MRLHGVPQAFLRKQLESISSANISPLATGVEMLRVIKICMRVN